MAMNSGLSPLHKTDGASVVLVHDYFRFTSAYVVERIHIFLCHCYEKMSEKFGKLTLQQLRTELRKRNARLTGRKDELIDR